MIIRFTPDAGGGGQVPDAAEAFRELLAKNNNDATRLAESLHRKNLELESDNRTYRQKINQVKSGLPPEGSVVLQGDDLKRWSKYQELGDPGEVRKSLEQGMEAVAQRDRYARGEQYRRAAEVSGFRPAVLARLAEQDGLTIEIGEVKLDGKAVPTALVKGEGDSTVPLNEYVEAHWSEFKPALGGGAETRKSPDSTPPRRPLGMGRLDSGDPDETARQKLQSTGIYKAGL